MYIVASIWSCNQLNSSSLFTEHEESLLLSYVKYANMQFSSIPNSKSGYLNCMRIGHWNLNGIISKQFGNKLELQEVFDKVKQFDLFGVSETHLLPKNGKQLDLY